MIIIKNIIKIILLKNDAKTIFEYKAHKKSYRQNII